MFAFVTPFKPIKFPPIYILFKTGSYLKHLIITGPVVARVVATLLNVLGLLFTMVFVNPMVEPVANEWVEPDTILIFLLEEIAVVPVTVSTLDAE